MKNYFVKTVWAISLICTTSVYAMEDFSNLEVRNGSKLPVKITVHYNIPGVDTQSSHQPVTIDLAPINADGVQDNKIIPNPKRYGLVIGEVEGGIKCYNVVDLKSEIIFSSSCSFLHYFSNSSENYDHPESPNFKVVPEWLCKSMSFKKFDLKGYAYNLTTKWNNLTEEQKKSPFSHDIPSCLHGLDTTPTMATPFPLCIKPTMKTAILNKYIEIHPEIKVTEQEITKLEGELKQKGIPFIH